MPPATPSLPKWIQSELISYNELINKDYLFSPTTSSSSSRNPRESTSHSISVVQWYPHDTGLFTTSSTDKTLKIWDTNCMMMVEKFSFSKIVYTHSLAAAESHPLIAGLWGQVIKKGSLIRVTYFLLNHSL